MTKQIKQVKAMVANPKPEIKVVTQKLPQEKIAIGEITGAHGIRGQIKVSPLTDFADLRFAVDGEVYLEKINKSLKIQQSQVYKMQYLLKLEGIDDRDTAQSLLHSYIKIDGKDVQPLPEGRYYHFQLIGLEVYEGDKHIGTLSNIRQTGANDVYFIKTADGSNRGEILLPALKTVVLSIDLAANKMLVKIPAGLLD